MVDFPHLYKLFIALQDRPKGNRYTIKDTCFLMGTGGRTNMLAVGRKNKVSSETKS